MTKPAEPNAVNVRQVMWMAEDLASTVARDGSPIRRVTTDMEWGEALSQGIPAFMEPGRPGLGLRYNVHARDIVAPTGWRVPTADHWDALEQAAAAGDTGALGLGFIDRRRAAYFGSDGVEDEERGAYWMSHSTTDESWGTRLEHLGVRYYACYTRWGALCDFGLFIRCVREA
jgi:hypothetical protein